MVQALRKFLAFLSLIILLMVAHLAITALEENWPFAHKAYALATNQNNLSFTFKKCNSDGGPLFDEYLEEMKWISSDVLYCRIVIPANCGDKYWFGSYEIVGEDKLVLKFRNVQFEFLACGACPVTLEYTISGLERKEYKIEILYEGQK